jgi:hypothetical protein
MSAILPILITSPPRQVAAVAGAYIGIGSVADERTCDDATDVVLIDKLASDVTKIVETFQTE